AQGGQSGVIVGALKVKPAPLGNIGGSSGLVLQPYLALQVADTHHQGQMVQHLPIKGFSLGKTSPAPPGAKRQPDHQYDAQRAEKQDQVAPISKGSVQGLQVVLDHQSDTELVKPQGD